MGFYSHIIMSDKQITQEALEQLVVLAQINERFHNMENSDPNAFHMWGEETQQRYLRVIYPILEPFAQHYNVVKKEMEVREKIYQKQISK